MVARSIPFSANNCLTSEVSCSPVGNASFSIASAGPFTAGRKCGRMGAWVVLLLMSILLEMQVRDRLALHGRALALLFLKIFQFCTRVQKKPLAGARGKTYERWDGGNESSIHPSILLHRLKPATYLLLDCLLLMCVEPLYHLSRFCRISVQNLFKISLFSDLLHSCAMGAHLREDHQAVFPLAPYMRGGDFPDAPRKQPHPECLVGVTPGAAMAGMVNERLFEISRLQKSFQGLLESVHRLDKGWSMRVVLPHCFSFASW